MNLRILLMTLVLPACAITSESSDVSIRIMDQGTYSDQSLCNLYVRAEKEALWGSLIRIEGVYRTDRQTYGWIKAQCDGGGPSGIEFARILTLDRAGFELMADGERRKCGEEVFCAYLARVVVVGRLLKEDSGMYGMVIEPLEIELFDVLE